MVFAGSNDQLDCIIPSEDFIDLTQFLQGLWDGFVVRSRSIGRRGDVELSVV